MIRLILAAAAAASLAMATPAEGQMEPLPTQRRERLEQQIRRSFWTVAKERIGFRDDQMQKLEQSARRFDVRRRAHAQQERAQRAILRDELTAPVPDEARVAAALDRLMALQHERLDIQEAEQRELATFMSPSQRGKFLALQEQVRRRADALRRARPDSGSRRGPLAR